MIRGISLPILLIITINININISNYNKSTPRIGIIRPITTSEDICTATATTADGVSLMLRNLSVLSVVGGMKSRSLGWIGGARAGVGMWVCRGRNRRESRRGWGCWGMMLTVGGDESVLSREERGLMFRRTEGLRGRKRKLYDCYLVVSVQAVFSSSFWMHCIAWIWG